MAKLIDWNKDTQSFEFINQENPLGPARQIKEWNDIISSIFNEAFDPSYGMIDEDDDMDYPEEWDYEDGE